MNLKNQVGFYANPKLLLILLLMVTAISCEKDDGLAPGISDKFEKHLQFLESTGFLRDDIVYDAARDEFIMDNDAVLSRKEVEAYMVREKFVPNGKVKQRRYTYIVSASRVTNIKYYIDGTVPADWRTAIGQAITEWNNVNGTALFISQVTTSAGADVRVNAILESGASWIARATLPSSSGAPGSIMTINTYYNTLDAGRKLFAMAHEMGHNFGLLHTNQTDGAIIPGTPATDANSVMNSFVLAWAGFTYYDQVAVQVLYPGGGGGGSATLRQHCDYTGWTANFTIGSYNLAAIQARGGINDDASSIRVPAGLRVTLYEHDNFTGATLVRTADDNCFVNEGWNDRVSSLRVEAN
jgi:hypothetical protein